MAPAIRAERTLSIAVGAVVVAAVLAKIVGGFADDWRPNHFDEWRSLAWAQRFVETGTLATEEPVGSPNGLARDIEDRNRSLGIVALYGAWLELAPNPIEAFKALAVAFLLLYVGGMYALMREVGIRRWARWPAVLALGALPTDPMLLGPAIAAPSSLSLGLLCLALVAHLRLASDGLARADLGAPRVSIGAWALFASTGLTLALVYPLSLIVFGGLVSVDVLARPRLLRTRYARGLASVAGVGVLVLLIGEWQNDAPATVRHLADLLLLDQSWHLMRLHEYRLDYLVLPPVLLLGVFGAGVAVMPQAPACGGTIGEPRDSPGPAASERSRVWIAAALLGPLLAYAGYHAFGAGLVVPYQRVGLYLNFGAILCTAVAIERLLEACDERSRAIGWKVAVVLLASAVIWVSPRAAPPYDGPTRWVRPEPALERAAARIAAEFSPPARIFTTPLEGLYLEALTGLRVEPGVLDSLLAGTPPPAIDCAGDWEIVVGRNSCPRYRLAFRIEDVAVYVLRAERDARAEAPRADER